MECKVCLNNYNQDNIRPKVLPCGHFFCCVCVKRLLKEGSLECPTCRSQHTIPDITQIPIAYDFEELLSTINIDSPEKSEEPEPQGDDAGDSIRLRRMRASLCRGTSGCIQMLSQLCTYDTTLGNLIKEHEEQVTNLTELIRSLKNAQQLLREEKGKVTNLQREGEQQHNSLRAAAEALNASNEEIDTDRAISHAEQCHGVALKWIEQCNDAFPNVNAIQQSAKLRSATKKTEELMNKEMAAGVPAQETDAAASLNKVLNSEHNATILDKVNNIVGITTESLTVESLRGLAIPVRLLVEAGKVAVVLTKHGKTLHGRTTLHESAICIHHLHYMCTSTTKDLHTLPFYDVASVETLSCLVFLDLAWPGSPPRRVYIRIIQNTLMAKHFVLLCTGEQGPSYANTHFFGVVCKGLPGERIVGGDYEYNDGSGGAAVITGVRGRGECKKFCCVGAVGGWVSNKSRAAQFTITTRESLFPYIDPRVFGQVERGLEVVKAAAKCGKIKDVMVVDCGIVIPR